MQCQCLQRQTASLRSVKTAVNTACSCHVCTRTTPQSPLRQSRVENQTLVPLAGDMLSGARSQTARATQLVSMCPTDSTSLTQVALLKM